jgi:hypothetical protein
MKINSICRKVVISALCLSLFSIVTLPSTAYARRTPVVPQVINPVSFETNKNVKIYKSNVSGSSYGWKLLLVIKISRPEYNEAVNNLWKNAGILDSERDKYQLVNIRQEQGTAWGIIICGQNYLTVTADVAISV